MAHSVARPNIPAMRFTRFLALALASSLFVAACGSSDDDKAKQAASSIKKQIEDATKGATSIPLGLGNGNAKCPDMSKKSGRMRVVNLATKNGAAVGPVDVYAQGFGPTQHCKPLFSAVGFGDVSDYLDVPAQPYQTPAEGGLTYFDAGKTDPTAATFWKNSSPPDGVKTGDQETVVLTGGSAKGEANPSYMNVTEKNAKDPSLNVKVKDGKALLLVNGGGAESAIGQTGNGENYVFTVDGKCLKPDAIAGDTGGGGSPGQVYGNGSPTTVEPGSHTVGIIVNDPGVGIGGEDCDGKTAAFTETVDVEAGKALAVYLGGTSKEALKIYSAAIDL